MYQFVHIETFARQASTKTKPSKPKNSKQAKAQAKAAAAVVVSDSSGGTGPKGMDAYVGTIKTPKTRASVGDILAEALRDADHCPHVANPQPPIFLMGDEATLRDIPALIERNLAAHHLKTGGRKVRSDAHVLLAGVASYPRELEQNDPSGYDRWEKNTLKWLQEKYGDNLRVVLRHGVDEAHPHIHFFVLSDERVNAKELHAGYAGAAAAIAEHGQLSKEARAAFNDSMRDYQTDYYEKVGHGAGLLRDGPKRLRETRDVYKAKEREARERVALDVAAESARVDLLDSVAIESKAATDLRRVADRAASALALEQVELDQLRASVELDRVSVQRDRAAVDVEWSRARARIADLDTREKVLSKSETDLAGREMLFAVKAAHVETIKSAAVQWESTTKMVLNRAEGSAREAEKLAKVFRDARPHLATVEDIGRLLQRPELQGMLEFVATSQDAQDLLKVMKTDPGMVEYLRSAVMVVEGMGSGQSVDWTEGLTTDWGAVLEASERAQKPAQKPASSGMDFGL